MTNLSPFGFSKRLCAMSSNPWIIDRSLKSLSLFLQHPSHPCRPPCPTPCRHAYSFAPPRFTLKKGQCHGFIFLTWGPRSGSVCARRPLAAGPAAVTYMLRQLLSPRRARPTGQSAGRSQGPQLVLRVHLAVAVYRRLAVGHRPIHAQALGVHRHADVGYALGLLVLYVLLLRVEIV